MPVVGVRRRRPGLVESQGGQTWPETREPSLNHGGWSRWTSVTIQNRYLLRPSAELNDLVLGVVGRAQRKYDMPIMCITVISSHFHILIFPRDAHHMAAFMEFVNTNISKEVGILHDWPGTMFPDRYKHIEVSDDPDD